MIKIRGIGKKILLSYLMLLLFVLLFTNITFWILSETYITQKTRDKLVEEGQHIANIYKETNYKKDVLESKFTNRKNFTIAGRFIDSNILVMNEKHELIYTDMDMEMIQYFTQADFEKEFQSSLNGYETAHVAINDGDKILRGHVFLITKQEDIAELISLNRESLSISIMFAMILAIVLGILFEKSITRPIKLLQKKMMNFSPSHPQYEPKIETGDEIENLDKCFMSMINKIVEIDRAKTTIFQNTSHELKTPLMSISGYAEAIKDGIAEGEAVEECLDIIIQESKRLRGTLDDLIYLSKVDEMTESYTFNETYLSDIIYTAIKAVQSLANDKQIELVYNRTDDHLGTYDESKLIRAFINILGNCIRYAESKIEIEVEKYKTFVKIVVSDDGTGFRENEENKIFERYYKGYKGSTGLGLSITKSIIQGHKGSISAHNGANGGAVFEIILPRV